MYIERPLKEYLHDLAAKKPAPGGGSAAALTGAMGAALLAMAANYTVGKEAYMQYEVELSDILSEVELLRMKFTELVDGDVAAYTKLAAAFKTKKGADMDGALEEATVVPLEIAETAAESLKQGLRLVDKCNTNLICDVGVANELLVAAYEGAKYNIDINLDSMKNKDFIATTRKKVESMDADVSSLSKNIKDKVKSIMEKK